MRNAIEFWWLARIFNEMDLRTSCRVDSELIQKAQFSEENVVQLDELFTSMRKLNI
jgi:hypothetical protein